MNLTNSNSPATKKQLWALFVGTGLNTTNCVMTVRQASNLIDNMKNGCDIETDLRSFGATGQVKKKIDYQDLYNKAVQAGKQAVEKCIPTPMVVQQRSNPLDDNSAIEQSWVVMDGPCGFASIRFKGNTAFAKWAVKNGIANKSCQGGCYIWVHEYNQSYEKKTTYAAAFSNVLNENGIKAFSESRLD